MSSKKSILSSITGSLTSTAPILLSCCKSGACIGVCASPVAALFGVSSASLLNSPLISVLEPVLIAVSAVSFTISYYSIYVIPKFSCNTGEACDCKPDGRKARRDKLNKFVFWFGLILSLGFLSYFEYSKYQQNTSSNVGTSMCEPGACEPGACDEESAVLSEEACDSTGTCCSEE